MTLIASDTRLPWQKTGFGRDSDANGGELGESVGHETSRVLGSSPALADVHYTISLQLFYAVKSEIDL